MRFILLVLGMFCFLLAGAMLLFAVSVIGATIIFFLKLLFWSILISAFLWVFFFSHPQKKEPEI